MESRREEDQVKALALLILSGLCLAYSGYQTFQGYATDLGTLNSLMLSTILTLAMMVLSISLRIDIKRGYSQNKIMFTLALYMLVASFSFIGNFNSFYKALMQDTVVREEIQEKLIVIQNIKGKLNDTFQDNEVDKMRVKTLALIDQFKSQLTNQMEPGLGDKAEVILKQIENTLGTPLTRLKGNDKSDEALKRMADQYEELIKRALEKSPLVASRGAFEKEQIKNELNKKIDFRISELEKASQDMTQSSYETREKAKIAIQQSVSTYKEVGSQIRRYNNNFIFNENLTLKNTNLGMISHTLSSSFSNLANIQTWVAIILALLIELFVPALVFALTPRGNASHESNGPSGRIEHI